MVFASPRTGATSELPSSAAPMSGVPYRRPASEGPMGPPGTVNPYASLSGATPNPYAGDGGRTPAFAAGRTPNPYGGATPSGGAWGFGGATPAPGGAGGRTPAYGIVQGGRTPAMGIQGGRTPAPVQGGRTPYGGGFDGGRTPAYGAGAAAGGRTPAYGGVMAGGRTPAYSGGYGGEPASYGGGQGAASAATPYGAGSSAYQDGPSKSAWNAPSNQNYGVRCPPPLATPPPSHSLTYARALASAGRLGLGADTWRRPPIGTDARHVRLGPDAGSYAWRALLCSDPARRPLLGTDARSRPLLGSDAGSGRLEQLESDPRPSGSREGQDAVCTTKRRRRLEGTGDEESIHMRRSLSPCAPPLFNALQAHLIRFSSQLTTHSSDRNWRLTQS
jgi:hypothetical protein